MNLHFLEKELETPDIGVTLPMRTKPVGDRTCIEPSALRNLDSPSLHETLVNGRTGNNHLSILPVKVKWTRMQTSLTPSAP